MNANSNTTATAQAAKTISELLNELLIVRMSTRQQARELAAQIQAQIIAEHAALIAVAEAAKILSATIGKSAAKDCLVEKIANLAAIRSQNGGAK